jgi:uncharacterized protein (DUF1501 family)
MDRRRFLQVAGIAGLAVMAPIAIRERQSSAGTAKYKGPFWIMVNAGGGWDPTMLCDPKGGMPGDPKSVNQGYLPGDKGKAGSIAYAPVSYTSGTALVQQASDFFDKHHARLMVINGLDVSTNNHDAGSRTVWSGQLAEGYPSFAALVAGVVMGMQPIPLAYMSNGGYDATAGVVSLTRLGSTDSLQKLAYTNEIDPTKQTPVTYHTPSTASRIQAAQAARIQALKQKESLPTVASAMGSLFLARQSNDGLAGLGAELKGVKLVDDADLGLDNVGGIGDLVSLAQQAQIALLAFQAGVAVSANLNIGGFDTHGDHDNRQGQQLMKLLRGLDYLFDTIDAMGLTGDVNVVVGSDFGRTPSYNQQNGKDHWNITSMMLSGPKIPKDKVVGATDDAFKPLTVDAKTLALDPKGVRIQTADVHNALRKLAGIKGKELEAQFPLAGSVMPFFS